MSSFAELLELGGIPEAPAVQEVKPKGKIVDLKKALGSIKNPAPVHAAKAEAPKPGYKPRLKRIRNSQDKELLATCKEIQARRLQAEELQALILVGISQGKDIYGLFLQAIDAVGLFTSNRQFREQARKDLVAVYGIGLEKPEALEVELSQVEERLKLLERPEKICGLPESDKQRVKKAIERHKEKAQELKTIIRQKREQKTNAGKGARINLKVKKDKLPRERNKMQRQA